MATLGTTPDLPSEQANWVNSAGLPTPQFIAFCKQVQLLGTQVTTVAALPSAVGRTGIRYIVTDANATTFMSTVASGGANIVPVFSNGTVWRIG
jgi:hypothetical protein